MGKKLRSVRWGILLAVLTILLGFAIGAVMGGAEAQLKAYWQATAQSGLATVYQNDPQKITAIVERSWKMLQRAHMHAAAIGTAALILMTVLASLDVPALYKKVLSLFLGAGGLGYSLSWLYVAFAAPTIGSIPLAKGSIHLLAAGSIGMLLLGTGLVLFLGLQKVFTKEI
jgi:hypothetical protein